MTGPRGETTLNLRLGPVYAHVYDPIFGRLALPPLLVEVSSR